MESGQGRVVGVAPIQPLRRFAKKSITPIGDDMTDEETRGRHQLIGIAASVWLPTLVRLVLDGASAAPLAMVVPGELFYGLVRGWGWARTWTTVSLGIGAVAATVGVFVADSLAHRAASALTAVAWALSAGVLSRSESIDAYCERRRDTELLRQR